MSSLRMLLGLAAIAVAAAGCYPQTASTQQTFPEPTEVAGPPGGQMDPNDPSYAPQPQRGTYAEDPNAAGDPQQQQMAPQGGQAGGQMDVSFDAQGGPDGQDQAAPQDSQDIQDPASATADVNDQQIDQTLDGQGSWQDVDGYGRVWRPDATVVGADFTPYETDGSWVDTDGGWAFDTGYSWGWLPFHYGRWGWFGNYWGWQPGYHYGSSWVDWRHGGGVVGWRPRAPEPRGPNARPLAMHDSHWKFAAEGQLNAHNIRSHEYGNFAEGLRQTQPVGSLAYHVTNRIPASSLMHGRPTGITPRGGTAFGRQAPTNRAPNMGNGSQPIVRNGIQQRGGDTRGAPTWQRPAQQAPQGYRQPSYRPAPQQSYRAPAYRQAPARQAPSYRMPSSSYHSPAPSRSSSSSYHSSSSSSSSYHSSGGGGHSSGGGGHSSGGGGGHHR